MVRLPEGSLTKPQEDEVGGVRIRNIPDFCSPPLSGCRSHPSRPPISAQSRPPIGGRLSAFSAEWTKIGASQWVLWTLLEGYILPFSSLPPLTSPVLPESGEEEGPSRCSEGNGDERGDRSRKDSFSGLLQSALFSAESRGDMEAYNRPLGSEHPHPVSVLQDGDQWVTSQYPSKRAMAHHSGFERHLLSHPHSLLLQAVPPVLQRGRGLAIPSSSFRVKHCTTSVYSGHGTCRGLRPSQWGSLHVYLDDWLLNPISEELAKQQTQWLLDLCTRLGWVVNVEKSSLTPSQVAIYLGISLDTRVGLAYPSERRIEWWLSISGDFLAGQAQTSPWAYQCVSRSSEPQRSVSENIMEYESSRSTECIPSLGQSTCGSVCAQVQHQTSNIHVSDSRTGGLESRQSSPIVGRSVRLCVPTNGSDQTDSEQVDLAQSRADPHSPPLAETGMVSGPPTTVNSFPVGTSTNSKVAKATILPTLSQHIRALRYYLSRTNISDPNRSKSLFVSIKPGRQKDIAKATIFQDGGQLTALKIRLSKC